jgi:hypothetical protein
LRKHADQIQNEGNVTILAIVPTDANQIKAFLDAFGPYPFQFLGDPQQNAYRELGHKHMPKWKLNLMAGIALLTGKMKLFPDDPKQKQIVKKAIKSQDVYQQGGTWLFSESGQVLWKHIDNDPADHATIQEILKQVV